MSFEEKFEELLKGKNISRSQIQSVFDNISFNKEVLCALLYEAVDNDCLEIVQYLMENGADPAFIISNGKNAVSLAVDQDKWEIVEFFLTKDFNRSLMFAGIEYLSPLMIDYLESKYIKIPHELKMNEDIDWINQIN